MTRAFLLLLCSTHIWAHDVVGLGSPRIVGGSDAKPGQFPYQVSVRRKLGGDHVCGGAILNENYVLTSALCATIFSPGMTIAVGSNHLSNPSQNVGVSKVTIHEDFDVATLANDIAVIQLAETLNLGAEVQPVALPDDGTEVPVGTTGVVSGFGGTTPDEDSSNTLQWLQTKVISNDICDAALLAEDGSHTTSQQLCLGSEEGQTICYGDSANPLVQDGALLGLLSRGFDCKEGTPAIFIKVSHYVNWLQSKVTDGQ